MLKAFMKIGKRIIYFSFSPKKKDLFVVGRCDLVKSNTALSLKYIIYFISCSIKPNSRKYKQ